MDTRRSARLLALALLATLPAFAADDPPAAPTPDEQAMMAAYQKAATPGPQHARLAATTGAYDMVVRSWSAPGAEPSRDTGTATRRIALGGRVLIEEIESTMMGQPFSGLGLSGYDNTTGKHWGTWSDTMGTGLMVTEGNCDEKDTCSFTGSWVDPVSKAKVTARMASRWSDASTQVFEMYGPGPDGQEMKMMDITYTRRP